MVPLNRQATSLTPFFSARNLKSKGQSLILARFDRSRQRRVCPESGVKPTSHGINNSTLMTPTETLIHLHKVA